MVQWEMKNKGVNPGAGTYTCRALNSNNNCLQLIFHWDFRSVHKAILNNGNNKCVKQF